MTLKPIAAAAAALFAVAVTMAGIAPSAAAEEQLADGWSKPQYIGRYPVSVSCTDPTFCVAVTDEGNAITYDGTNWSDPVAFASGTPNSVSCPTRTFCVAVTKRGTAYTYNGHTWSKPETIDASSNVLYAVSCSSTKFCMAIDIYGHVIRYNGLRWSQPQLLTNNVLSAVSCTSRHFCVVLLDHGASYSFDGTSWAYDGVTGDVAKDMSISCASSHFCASAGRKTSIYDGKTWGSTTRLERNDGGLSAVSCPSRTFCALINTSGGVYLYDGDTWGPRTRIDTREYAEASVSCPTRDFCATVNTHGNAVFYRS